MRKIRLMIINLLDNLSLLIDPNINKHNPKNLTSMTRKELIKILENTMEEVKIKDKKINELSDLIKYDYEPEIRQIIILLDVVEGVARGDLTVKVNVSELADVAGGLADAFNLIVDNMIEVVNNLPANSPLRKKFKLPPE